MNLERLWYGRHPLAWLLLPLSWLYCAAGWVRRRLYRYRLLPSVRPPVPVIVVGNLTVGGSGKTPLVLWLCELLRQQGLRPGVVSRGYGGQANTWPRRVYPDSDPSLVGDEPVLLAQRGACPVAVAPRRAEAVALLLRDTDCNVVISDDGLQHYALQRDIEISLLDSVRGYGNRHCLPAGPLREPLGRLREVDFVITKGPIGQGEVCMRYELLPLRNLRDPQQTRQLSELRGQSVHAVAGVGHPAGFFRQLQDQGLKVIPHPFADHHPFRAEDLEFGDDLPVLMTEKDAVKCRSFAQPRHWYLPVAAQLPAQFEGRLLELLHKRLSDGQKVAGNPGLPGV